jgi:hypothetical protein
MINPTRMTADDASAVSGTIKSKFANDIATIVTEVNQVLGTETVDKLRGYFSGQFSSQENRVKVAVS